MTSWILTFKLCLFEYLHSSCDYLNNYIQVVTSSIRIFMFCLNSYLYVVTYKGLSGCAYLKSNNLAVTNRIQSIFD